MNETEYDDIYEFVKHMRSNILFDMRSPVSVMATGAEVMKTLIREMDEGKPNQEDLENIYELAVILSDASQRLANNIDMLGDNLKTLASKKKNSD